MEDLAGIALTIATGLLGVFVMVYVLKLQNEALVVVATGLVDDKPISVGERWLWLLQIFLGMAIGVLLLDFFLVFAFVTIAGAVGEGIRPLAYLGAASFGLAFFTQFVWGANILARNVSRLREAGKDSP